jgi:hypothetical protein
MNSAMVPAVHPIDRALSNLDEAVALLVTSGRPSRFSEIRRLSQIASDLARLRPAAGVDDVELEDEDYDDLPMPRRRRRFAPINDAVDMQRELGDLIAYLDTPRSRRALAGDEEALRYTLAWWPSCSPPHLARP